MQLVLNKYFVAYNRKRPHQGRRMNGRTPWQAFQDGLPSAKANTKTNEPQERKAASPPLAVKTTKGRRCQVTTIFVQSETEEINQEVSVNPFCLYLCCFHKFIKRVLLEGSDSAPSLNSQCKLSVHSNHSTFSPILSPFNYSKVPCYREEEVQLAR